MNKKILGKFLIILLSGGLLVGFVLVVNHGLKRIELVECQQWAKDSKNYATWYSKDWQVEQCSSFGIQLNK